MIANSSTGGSPCRQCQGIERFFAGGCVGRQLRKYRRRGPASTTQILIDGLVAQGVVDATLLDIGGGIGVVQHELLKLGIVSAASVEVASEYAQASRDEAQRQGHGDRITFYSGNFVELAPQLQGADLVTLDRVICCYHDMESLVTRSVEKARRVYGLVYPRDDWWVRIGISFTNLLLRLTRNPFRTFLHPSAAVEEIVGQAGFTRRLYRKTLVWQIVVFSR